MCIVALAWQMHAQFPLVLLNNRDEFLARPTQPMHWWADDAIWAGKDLAEHGTWLACDPQGRFAVVTNVREGKASALPNARSRGELVRNFFTQQNTPAAYATQLDVFAYNGFNLVVGDTTQAVYVSNRGVSAQGMCHQRQQYPLLPNNLYVFSNASLHSVWPKTQRLHTHVQQVLQQHLMPQVQHNGLNDDILYALLHCLHDATKAPLLQLPKTGIPFFMEYLLSSIFIDAPHYGTRSSTLLLHDTAQNAMHMHYMDYDQGRAHKLPFAALFAQRLVARVDLTWVERIPQAPFR